MHVRLDIHYNKIYLILLAPDKYFKINIDKEEGWEKHEKNIGLSNFIL
jgi:hypothetical protein